MIFADTPLENVNSILVACLPYDFASTNTDLLCQHLISIFLNPNKVHSQIMHRMR